MKFLQSVLHHPTRDWQRCCCWHGTACRWVMAFRRFEWPLCLYIHFSSTAWQWIWRHCDPRNVGNRTLKHGYIPQDMILLPRPSLPNDIAQCIVLLRLQLSDGHSTGTAVTVHCAATPTAVSWTLYRYFSYNALCCYTHSCQMDTLQVLQLQCIVLLHPQLSDGHSTGTSVTMHQSRKCVIPVVCVWN